MPATTTTTRTAALIHDNPAATGRPIRPSRTRRDRPSALALEVAESLIVASVERYASARGRFDVIDEASVLNPGDVGLARWYDVAGQQLENASEELIQILATRPGRSFAHDGRTYQAVHSEWLVGSPLTVVVEGPTLRP